MGSSRGQARAAQLSSSAALWLFGRCRLRIGKPGEQEFDDELGHDQPKAIATMIRSAVAPSTMAEQQVRRWAPARRDQIQQTARLAENVDTRNQRHTTDAKAKSRKRHAQAVGDRSHDRAEQEAGNKRAPVSALPPPGTIMSQREACASMPMAIGIGSMRQGMAKNVP